eukprot:3000268-Amphidinium_carterae.1
MSLICLLTIVLRPCAPCGCSQGVRTRTLGPYLAWMLLLSTPTAHKEIADAKSSGQLPQWTHAFATVLAIKVDVPALRSVLHTAAGHVGAAGSSTLCCPA